MTVETLILPPSSPPAPPGGGSHKENGLEEAADTTTSSSSSDAGGGSGKALFVWSPLPGFCQGDLSRYQCDLCGNVFSAETGLKEHQLSRHINPVYLSEQDRLQILEVGREKVNNGFCDASEIKSARLRDSVEEGENASEKNPLEKNGFLEGEEQDKEGTQYCQAKEFQGLFRCHHCFQVWDLRSELRHHLDQEHPSFQEADKDGITSSIKPLENGSHDPEKESSEDNVSESPEASPSREQQNQSPSGDLEQRLNGDDEDHGVPEIDEKLGQNQLPQLEPVQTPLISSKGNKENTNVMITSKGEEPEKEIKSKKKKKKNSAVGKKERLKRKESKAKDPEDESVIVGKPRAKRKSSLSTDSSESQQPRPERKCKSQAKTLVALALDADLLSSPPKVVAANPEESATDHVGDSPKGDETTENMTASPQDSSPSLPSTSAISIPGPVVPISQSGEKAVANSSESIIGEMSSFSSLPKRHRQVRQRAKTKETTAAVAQAGGDPSSQAVTAATASATPPVNGANNNNNKRGKTKKKKKIVSKKLRTSIKKQPQQPKNKRKKLLLPERKRLLRKGDNKSKAATAAAPVSKTKKTVSSGPSIEDILPDLKPRPPPGSSSVSILSSSFSSSSRMAGSLSKRASCEAEKTRTLVKVVTERDQLFSCLKCREQFNNFMELLAHRKRAHASKASQRLLLEPNSTEKSKETPNLKVEQSPLSEAGDQPDYSSFLSNAIRAVPECTFNHMHGTIKDLLTQDGTHFRSKPSLATLEKVRMNISGPWTTKDVWESGGGWEIGRDPLSWHKYESGWSDKRPFLEGISRLNWPTQRAFKQVFDGAVAAASKGARASWRRHNDGSSESEIDSKSSVRKKETLHLALGLKQVSKSVKYMTIAEREEKKKARDGYLEPRYQGELRGEWELEHNYTCTTCAKTYDDLRDAMEHKWDDHPYVLVAHVTLLRNLNLPPNGMMHPQLGKNLRHPAQVLARRGGRKNTKAVKKEPTKPFQCSKCPGEAGIFEDQAKFYAHVLVCGGDPAWDPTKKKGNKKKKSNNNNSNTNSGAGGEKKKTEISAEEAAEKRKARFAKFAQPSPLRSTEGTRVTRHLITKINEIAKEKKKGKGKKWMGGKKKKKKAITPKSEINDKTSEKKNSVPNGKLAAEKAAGVIPPKKKKELSSLDSLPSRPRRSMINYARDVSLREGWETSSRGSAASIEQLESVLASEVEDVETKEELENSETKIENDSAVADQNSRLSEEVTAGPAASTSKVSEGVVVKVLSQVDAPDEIRNIAALETDEKKANSAALSEMSASPRKRDRSYKSLGTEAAVESPTRSSARIAKPRTKSLDCVLNGGLVAQRIMAEIEEDVIVTEPRREIEILNLAASNVQQDDSTSPAKTLLEKSEAPVPNIDEAKSDDGVLSQEAEAASKEPGERLEEETKNIQKESEPPLPGPSNSSDILPSSPVVIKKDSAKNSRKSAKEVTPLKKQRLSFKKSIAEKDGDAESARNAENKDKLVKTNSLLSTGGKKSEQPSELDPGMKGPVQKSAKTMHRNSSIDFDLNPSANKRQNGQRLKSVDVVRETDVASDSKLTAEIWTSNSKDTCLTPPPSKLRRKSSSSEEIVSADDTPLICFKTKRSNTSSKQHQASSTPTSISENVESTSVPRKRGRPPKRASVDSKIEVAPRTEAENKPGDEVEVNGVRISPRKRKSISDCLERDIKIDETHKTSPDSSEIPDKDTEVNDDFLDNLKDKEIVARVEIECNGMTADNQAPNPKRRTSVRISSLEDDKPLATILKRDSALVTHKKSSPDPGIITSQEKVQNKADSPVKSNLCKKTPKKRGRPSKNNSKPSTPSSTKAKNGTILNSQHLINGNHDQDPNYSPVTKELSSPIEASQKELEKGEAPIISNGFHDPSFSDANTSIRKRGRPRKIHHDSAAPNDNQDQEKTLNEQPSPTLDPAPTHNNGQLSAKDETNAAAAASGILQPRKAFTAAAAKLTEPTDASSEEEPQGENLEKKAASVKNKTPSKKIGVHHEKLPEASNGNVPAATSDVKTNVPQSTPRKRGRKPNKESSLLPSPSHEGGVKHSQRKAFALAAERLAAESSADDSSLERPSAFELNVSKGKKPGKIIVPAPEKAVEEDKSNPAVKLNEDVVVGQTEKEMVLEENTPELNIGRPHRKAFTAAAGKLVEADSRPDSPELPSAAASASQSETEEVAPKSAVTKKKNNGDKDVKISDALVNSGHRKAFTAASAKLVEADSRPDSPSLFHTETAQSQTKDVISPAHLAKDNEGDKVVKISDVLVNAAHRKAFAAAAEKLASSSSSPASVIADKKSEIQQPAVESSSSDDLRKSTPETGKCVSENASDLPARAQHRKSFIAAAEHLAESSSDESALDMASVEFELVTPRKSEAKAKSENSAKLEVKSKSDTKPKPEIKSKPETKSKSETKAIKQRKTKVSPANSNLNDSTKPPKDQSFSNQEDQTKDEEKTPVKKSSQRRAFAIASENLAEDTGSSADESALDERLPSREVSGKCKKGSAKKSVGQTESKPKKTNSSSKLASSSTPGTDHHTPDTKEPESATPAGTTKTTTPTKTLKSKTKVESPVINVNESENKIGNDSEVQQQHLPAVRTSHRKAFTLAAERLAESSEDDSFLERPIVSAPDNLADASHQQPNSGKKELEIEFSLHNSVTPKKKHRHRSGSRSPTKSCDAKRAKIGKSTKSTSNDKIDALPSSKLGDDDDVFAWNDEDDAEIQVMGPLRKTPPKMKLPEEIKKEVDTASEVLSSGIIANGTAAATLMSKELSAALSDSHDLSVPKDVGVSGRREEDDDDDDDDDGDAPSTKVACLASVFGRKSKSPQKKLSSSSTSPSPPKNSTRPASSPAKKIRGSPMKSNSGSGSSSALFNSLKPLSTPRGLALKRRRASHDAGTLSGASSPKRPTPSRRNSSEYSSDAPLVTPEGISKRRTTAEDLLFSAAIIGETSRRRRNSPALINCDPYVGRRTVFPVEVKLEAIKRIEGGDPQATVARDLEVSVSTVASWWKGKDKLMGQSKNGTDKTDDSCSSKESSPAPSAEYLPFRKNQLLAKMKRRISEDLERREEQQELASSRSESIDSQSSSSNSSTNFNVGGKSDSCDADGEPKFISSSVTKLGSELTSRASSGLSMIVDNYDGELSDDSEC